MYYSVLKMSESGAHFKKKFVLPGFAEQVFSGSGKLYGSPILTMLL